MGKWVLRRDALEEHHHDFPAPNLYLGQPKADWATGSIWECSCNKRATWTKGPGSDYWKEWSENLPPIPTITEAERFWGKRLANTRFIRLITPGAPKRRNNGIL